MKSDLYPVLSNVVNVDLPLAGRALVFLAGVVVGAELDSWVIPTLVTTRVGSVDLHVGRDVAWGDIK